MNALCRKTRGVARSLTVRLLAVSLVLFPFAQSLVAEDAVNKKISYSIAFDDAAAQGVAFSVGSSSTIGRVSGFGKSGKTALKVSHTAGKDYVSYNTAVRVTFPTPLPAGGTYNIVCWIYAPAAGNEGKDALTGPGVVLNGEYGRGDYKLPGQPGTLNINDWKEVNITTPMMETPLRFFDIRLVVNDGPKQAEVWYVDDVAVTQVGEIVKQGIPEWNISLPSIAEKYKASFLIGNIMNSAQTAEPDTTAMYKKQYNVMTAENEMKPQYLSPAKGSYSYGNADKLISWAAANGIKVHGHTLVWHSQSAAWLTSGADGKPLSRVEARANMQDYIANVAGHFRGKVISWDVVNEAFDGGREIPKDWRAVMRFNSPWYIAYENGAEKAKGESGADYVYDAFVFARLADPGATLYYNDYNETEAWKREAMGLMAEELNGKWKKDPRNTQPARLLVEGLGMQSHFWTGDLNVADVDAAIARFVKAGVKVSVTELDIPAGTYASQRTPPLTKDEEVAQAKLYARLFQVYAKYAKDIERVTFWGKADVQSWRANGSPLLFDKLYAPKKAYDAVMDPEGFLKVNP
jgi:GH35 family endo-1,4-beta-xylanase